MCSRLTVFILQRCAFAHRSVAAGYGFRRPLQTWLNHRFHYRFHRRFSHGFNYHFHHGFSNISCREAALAAAAFGLLQRAPPGTVWQRL